MVVPYEGEFESWADVQEQFRMKEPEPDEVLLAVYDYGNYEGDAYAYVIYRRNQHYFIAEGHHCSCYGLEGQWEPESYDLGTFLAVLNKYSKGSIGTFYARVLRQLTGGV